MGTALCLHTPFSSAKLVMHKNTRVHMHSAPPPPHSGLASVEVIEK